MDWVVITARPATTNARIPNTVSKTLASNAAANASSDIRLNVDSRWLSFPVALMTRMPTMLSCIQDVSWLLRSRARRKATLSGDEK